MHALFVADLTPVETPIFLHSACSEEASCALGGLSCMPQRRNRDSVRVLHTENSRSTWPRSTNEGHSIFRRVKRGLAASHRYGNAEVSLL
jgi:hypothetical protein